MDFLREFRAPERRFSVAAFWFWNGELKSQRLLWQMDQMAEKGVYNAFMHARAYLVTPYLGEEWFSLVGNWILSLAVRRICVAQRHGGQHV